MKPGITLHELTTSSLSLLAALFVAFAFLVLGSLGGLKLLVVVVGGIGLLTLLMLARDQRQLLLWLLVFCLPLALSKQFGEILYKGGGEQAFRLELYDIFVVWLLLYQLRDLTHKREPGVRVPRLLLAWLAIISLGIFHTVLGPWHVSGAHEVFRMIKIAVMFIVVVNEVKRPQQLYLCITSLAAGVLLQGLVAVVQYLRGGLLGLEFLGETSTATIAQLAATSVEGIAAFRPSALLSHANILGIYMAGILPVLIGSCMLMRSIRARVFIMLSILVGLLALILSQSRSAWVSFAIAYAILVILMISHRRFTNRGIYTAGVSALAMIVVLIPSAERIFNRLFSSLSDATVGRQVFAADFYRLIEDHWLWGVGLNAYSYEIVPYLSYPEEVYEGWIPPVHNIYYLWWAETGLPGLILHMSVWIGFIWVAIRNLKVSNDLLFILNAAALAAMLAYLFDGFLSFSLRVSEPLRIFFFQGAVIYAVRYFRLRETSHRYQHVPG